MDNKKPIVIALTLLFFTVSSLFAQNTLDLNETNYKFKISFPSGWSQKKVEETTKQDAISYTFDKKDGKIAAMLIAFKVSEVKNLEDFVYTLEKDLTLNIPKRDGEYTDFDSGIYDGKWAKYKDTEFVEVIYYYRTKITDGENFSYLLRFIVPSNYYNSTTEEEIKNIAGTFLPVSE